MSIFSADRDEMNLNNFVVAAVLGLGIAKEIVVEWFSLLNRRGCEEVHQFLH